MADTEATPLRRVYAAGWLFASAPAKVACVTVTVVPFGPLNVTTWELSCFASALTMPAARNPPSGRWHSRSMAKSAQGAVQLV